MKFDLDKLFAAGGPMDDSSNLPSPVEICMATPASPVCDTLSKTLLAQLCAHLPTSPLCPGVGPDAPGGSTSFPGIGGLLGGLRNPGPGTGSTTSQQPGMFRLLGGSSGGGP